MFNFEENNKEALSHVSVNKEDFVLVQDNVKISVITDFETVVDD